MNDGVNYDSTLRVLPHVLKKSGLMFPLAQTTAKFLEGAWNDAQLANIYCRIDELDESLLDILAVDFGVAWYWYDYPIETKRRIIKDSFYVHRFLGTIGATKQALCSVWPDSTVEEWFEYDGEPYHFRVYLDSAIYTQEIDERTRASIATAKNVRSWLDSISVKSRIYTDVYAGSISAPHNQLSLANDVKREAETYINPKIAVAAIGELIATDVIDQGREREDTVYLSGYAGSVLWCHVNNTMEVG